MQTETDSVLRFFPIPRILAPKGIGLEISEHSIKFLSFEGHTELRLGVWGGEDLKEGIVVDGQIEEPQALVKVLERLSTQFSTNRVHVSLPEQKGYVFRVSLPTAQTLPVREAIAFRLEEHIPLHPEETVFDYEYLPHESSTSAHEFVVTAYPRVTVETYYEVLQSAGLSPLSFEMESQAAARAVVAEGDMAARMIVDFGETRTALAIVEAGVVRFTTSLDVAGSALSAALVRGLGITAEEAALLKTEEGIAPGTKASTVLINAISALRDEINRHFVYWHTHAEASDRAHSPIKSLILCGGNANVRGFPEYLSQTMRIPVVRADVWQRAFNTEEYVAPVPYNESLRYATVIGLALRSHVA